MVKDYADWCFSSVAASEDAGWPQEPQWSFGGPETATSVLKTYQDEVSAEALRLYVNGLWSQLKFEHAELLFNAVQNYKPDTKLPYSMQLMWDALTMIRNLLAAITDQPKYSLDCLQHLVEPQLLREVPPRAVTDGLTLPEFEAWSEQLATSGHHEARQ